MGWNGDGALNNTSRHYLSLYAYDGLSSFCLVYSKLEARPHGSRLPPFGIVSNSKKAKQNELRPSYAYKDRLCQLALFSPPFQPRWLREAIIAGRPHVVIIDEETELETHSYYVVVKLEPRYERYYPACGNKFKM